MEKLTLKFRRPRVGEIVTDKTPPARETSLHDTYKVDKAKYRFMWVKRLVALGPTKVVVNGQVFEVPEGHAWLQGDNRDVSADSRQFGPVPISAITGRLVARIYPRSRMARLPPSLDLHPNIQQGPEGR